MSAASKGRPDLLAQRDQLVRRDPPARKEQLAPLAQLVQPARLERKVLLGRRGLLVPTVLMVQPGQPAQQDQRVRLDQQVQRARPAPRDQQVLTVSMAQQALLDQQERQDRPARHQLSQDRRGRLAQQVRLVAVAPLTCRTPRLVVRPLAICGLSPTPPECSSTTTTTGSKPPRPFLLSGNLMAAHRTQLMAVSHRLTQEGLANADSDSIPARHGC